MATVTREIAMTLLDDDGFYPGDPQAHAVYRYRNNFDGSAAYSICYDRRAEASLLASPACHDCTLLWSRATGLTRAGQEETER